MSKAPPPSGGNPTQGNSTFVIPMTSKPGVQRDVTSFSSLYYTDAFWNRFVNGTPQKMGGQYALKFSGAINNDLTALSYIVDFQIMFYLPQGQPKPLLFRLLADYNVNDNNYTLRARAAFINGKEAAPGDDIPLVRLVTTLGVTDDYITIGNQIQAQILIIKANGISQPLIMATPYLGNANPNGALYAENFYANLDEPIFSMVENPARFVDSQITPVVLEGLKPTSNIGMCFVNPYLFVYGIGGEVQYSAINNPLNFTSPTAPDRAAAFLAGTDLPPKAPAEAARHIAPVPDPAPSGSIPDIQTAWNIINDQFIAANNKYEIEKSTAGGTIQISDKGEPVLFGHSLRGGANSPSLLFWTPTELVRIYNIQGGEGVNFQKEVVSSNISTVSSRCVVEYNNAFWWRGTNSFYIYNGVSLEIRNPVDGQFLFRNEDPLKRHLAFTVANPTYGEIWFFYAEKPRPSERAGQPAVTPESGVTRAVIFCEREPGGVFFDTEVRRNCGRYISEWGSMLTCGAPLINPDPLNPDPYPYFWEHVEDNFTVDQAAALPPAANPPVLGAIVIAPITSSYTTSVISFAAPTASNSTVGADTTFSLQKFEPDYVMHGKGAVMSFTPLTRLYAQGTITAGASSDFTSTTPFIPLEVQTAHLQLQFSSTSWYHQGKPLLTLGPGSRVR